MIRNFIYVKDNFLSEKECDEVIKFFKTLPNDDKSHDKDYHKEGKYNGVFMFDNSPYLKNDILSFLKERFQKELNEYIKIYPELNYVGPFYLTEIRFKHWKDGSFFENWHSEHSIENSNRILNFMIYLSTHDCGTQFLDKRIIKSEKGRLAILPSYFTHTHRGMPCPEGKDRYMFGGYFNFSSMKNKT
jgi:hypothetical protein|tara:strand:+ start:5489 stop:6052 length:564 start_codon:yes stop_codon:yes gene_type:complete